MAETTIQRGLFGTDYAVSTSRITCADVDEIHVCPSCTEEVGIDSCIENPDGDLWCEDCINDHCVYCERCDAIEYCDDSAEITVRNGSWNSNTTQVWCEDCTDNHAVKCDDCDNYVPRDDRHITAGNGNICSSCYEDGYFTCENCSDIFHLDDCVSSESGCYCNGCRSEGGDFDPNGFRNRSGSLTEIGSARCYGIELETDECDGYHDLEDSEAWGAKDDCTVAGKEFYSDILNGDDGLDAVRDWASVADNNGWQAGSDCGLHLHLDVRGDSDEQRFAIAFAYRATESVWLAFVEQHRSSCSYSHTIRWTCPDVAAGKNADTSFHYWAGNMDRYNWVNCYAYCNHETIEIRLHQGTCDELEIINWVKAHTRFADWAATKGYAGVVEALNGLDNSEKFDLIASEAWQDDDLCEYYNNKAARYTGHRF